MTEEIISFRDTLRFEVKMLHTLRLQNYLGSLKDEIVYSCKKPFTAIVFPHCSLYGLTVMAIIPGTKIMKKNLFIGNLCLIEMQTLNSEKQKMLLYLQQDNG